MEQIKQIDVLHLDGFGVGPVEPTESYTDEQVTHEVARKQEALADKHIVCVDERQSVLGEQPVRLKVAGGAGMSGFEGGILGGWYLLGDVTSRSANETFDFVTTLLGSKDIAIGGHIDNHTNIDDANAAKTNCGATDGAPAANKRIVELGHSRLEAKVAALMGDDFDTTMFKTVVEHAQELERVGFFNDWNPVEAMKLVRKRGVVEILDGDNDALANPDRHGHYAEAVNFNTTAGFSSNRDRTEIPFFQLDKQAVDVIADSLGRNSEEKRQIRHGIYAYNVSIVFGLTKNQRLTIS